MVMYIYGLRNFIDNNIRYIGQTNNPEVRLKYHLSHYKIGKSHSKNWIKNIIDNGGSLAIDILEIVLNDEDTNDREQYWIKYGRDSGWRLTNLSDGGFSSTGYQWTNDQRKKFSDKKKGILFTDQHKKALSKAQKDRLKSKPHVRLGMKHSEEAKAKMSESKIGKSLNVDHDKRSLDRASEWNDPEIRRKRSEGIKLKWQDPEYRSKHMGPRKKKEEKNNGPYNF